MSHSQDQQSHVLRQFSPHLDSDLIMAILNEPGQSQPVAIQTLSNLVESISGRPFAYQPQSPLTLPSTQDGDDGSMVFEAVDKPDGSSVLNEVTRGKTSRRGGAANSSRRAFQGKLTQEAFDAGLASQPPGKRNSRMPSQHPSGTSSSLAQEPSSSPTPPESQSASADSEPPQEEDLERDLEEQKQNEAEIRLDLERLKLLDRLDEEEEKRRWLAECQDSENQTSQPSPSAASCSSPRSQIRSQSESDSFDFGDTQEKAEQAQSSALSNNAYSTSSGEQEIDLNEISSSQSSLLEENYNTESASSSEAGSSPSAYSSDEPLAFLQTVFPNSTKTALRTALEACDGDAPMALDLLIAQSLAEEEQIALERERNNAHITQDGINGLTWDEIEFRSGQRSEGNGLNDLLLEKGTRSSSLSPRNSLGPSEADKKGKKGRNARRRAREEELAAKNGTLTPIVGGKNSSKTIINLTDVRHGAPIKNRSIPLSRPSDSSSSSSSAGLETTVTHGLSDEELGRRLNAEERALMGEGPPDSPVTDNSWLLTSSILSQLSTLLDLPPSKITSAYNLSSFNLAITFSRLLTYSSDQYTLEELDERGSAPSGTASGLVKAISSLTGTSLEETEKAFRATKGRQDSTIDLLQLWKTVVETSDPKTLPDALDPLARLRDDGAKKANADALAINPKAKSVNVGENAGRFSAVRSGFPSLNGSSSSPSYSSSSSNPHSTSAAASQYARAALRNASNSSSASPAALALASGASSVSLPLSSSRISTPSDSDLLSISSSDINSLQLSYAECRAKEESYRLKANSYRQSAGQAYRKASGGSNSANGLGAGGIAWYYANEVTRMDNMRYEWGKRAALALVRDRQRSSMMNLNHNPSHLGSYSSASTRDGHTSSRNVVDLHGLTKQESLSVLEKCLNNWYSQPSNSVTGSGLQPFTIITGAGRHSRGGVSILKPAIKKWLEHNGWRIARDTDEGVLRVVGTK